MKKTLIALMALAGVAMAETFTMDQLVATGTMGSSVTLDANYTADKVYSFVGDSAITNITSAGLTSALQASTGFITIAAWVNQTEGSEDAIFSFGGQNDGFKFALKNDKL